MSASRGDTLGLVGLPTTREHTLRHVSATDAAGQHQRHTRGGNHFFREVQEIRFARKRTPVGESPCMAGAS